MTDEPEDARKLIQFQMRWPRWLAEQAAQAARDQTLSTAAWLREAAIEKLLHGGPPPDALSSDIEAVIEEGRRRKGLEMARRGKQAIERAEKELHNA